MNVVRLLPVVLSLLVLGAHFLRDGSVFFVLLILTVMLLLFVRQAWVARLTQIVLIVGGLEWLRTVFTLIRLRQETGEPWTRMAVILGSVAAITFASSLLFQTSGLRRRYRTSDGSGDTETSSATHPD